MQSVDTLIIGAGPSGSACAITLLRSGADCLLVDKRIFPRVKLCGGLFTRKAQGVLHDLLGDIAYQKCMQEVTCSREKQLTLWRRQEKIVSLEPYDEVILVDRPKLDYYLVQYYQSIGGMLLEGDGLCHLDFRSKVATLSSGKQILYKHLIAADGTNSSVERLLAAYDSRFKRKKGKVATLEINVEKEDLTVEGVNIYFDVVPKTYAWAFNKGDKTCLGICKMPDQDFDVNQRFRDFLQNIGLKHLERYPLRGAMIPYGQVTPECQGGSVRFVGDAAGLVEPLTWEGIYYALRSGQMAAESLLTGKSYSKMVGKMRKKIRHGYFYQRLFEWPCFMNLFYIRAPRHKAFMARYYSNNIDNLPKEPLLKKVVVLIYKIIKHTLFG